MPSSSTAKARQMAADINRITVRSDVLGISGCAEAMGADKTRGQLYTVDIPEDSECWTGTSRLVSSRRVRKGD